MVDMGRSGRWPEIDRLPYKDGWVSARRILVAAPHPDDETLACGGALCRYVKEGSKICVLVLTDGAGLANVSSEKQDLATTRLQELRNAMEILGVPWESVVIWGEPDRSLEVNQRLLDRLQHLLLRIRPDLCLIPSPYEHHPDHLATSNLFIHLLPWLSWKIEVAFYEILPLPKVNLLVDISNFIEQKTAALSAYKSQLSQRDYKGMLLGLNKFRTWSLPPEILAVEAFRFFSSNDVPRLPAMILQDERMISPYSSPAQDKKVSVVIRTRNRPEALRQAVESVLAQTWRGIEIIVVNDGTSETTIPFSEIPIRILRTEDRANRSHAANLGWKQSQGSMVAFLDDDDLYTRHHIETLLLALSRNPWCSIAYSGVIEENENGLQNFISLHPMDLSHLLKENFLPIHSVLIRREALEAVGGFDENLEMFEDWDLWLRLALANYGFIPVKAWTAIYRKHGYSTLTQTPFGSDHDLNARWRVVHKYENEIRNRLAHSGPVGRFRLILRKLLFKIAKGLLC
ncbi:MAG: PIG-L family deacetylase [Deltaproteobacteria bacterium]|uniref:PIG-L family deacetylase n=1 Tax=Candidatus Desulfacyla euxinica TaxID=2841693 RepID=A0A8J6MZ24_9DELT|nr:PIG-L family deacetylase [Candidatus Desulfacyla euxinica]